MKICTWKGEEEKEQNCIPNAKTKSKRRRVTTFMEVEGGFENNNKDDETTTTKYLNPNPIHNVSRAIVRTLRVCEDTKGLR